MKNQGFRVSLLGTGFLPALRFNLSSSFSKLSVLASLTLGLTAFGALPPGWTDADIGSPGVAGSAAYTNGGWTISGGGADIGLSADQGNFALQTFNSDGALVALVTSLQNVDASGWSKCGVVFRNDATAGAANAMMVISATQGAQFQYRLTAGGASAGTAVSGLTVPLWLKVARSGEFFTGYYSKDGTNWTQVGTTQTIPMNGPALAGLGVTAHNNANLNTATFTNVAFTTTGFGVYRELWTNLNQNVGNALAALTNTANNPGWPLSPVASFTHVYTNFETEANTGMNYYGQRMRAFVVPPTNGQYTFWIASDDTSQLFLSTNESPAGMQPIAQQTSYNNPEVWNAYPNQQSTPITLQAGVRYYIEAQMQQGSDGDNLSVAWQLPNGTMEGPMQAVSAAGTFLIPANGIDTPPGIYSQPTNVAAFEGQPATLSVLSTNGAPVSYRWFTGGTNIPGATQAVYTLNTVSVTANNGQSFVCVVSNSLGTTTSAPISLAVARDTTPPVVTGAFNVGLTNFGINFSKTVSAATATTLANYAFTDGLAISGAVLQANGSTVILTTGGMTYGSNYTVVINNIQDTASVPNTIASNTTASATAAPLAPQDIGNPLIPSTAIYVTNGAETVSSAGTSIGGNSDQCNLEYQIQTGNFDVSVRLASLGVSSLWAQAGLMARANLTAGSAFAAALASPGVNGDSFVMRVSAGGAATSSGSFPANYPNTWLRLSRSGNLFTGYGSYDGTNWTQLGSATLTLGNQVYLGLTVASDATNQLTTAQFVNYATTSTNAQIATQTNPHEPPGPSARTTGVVISEIMYKPAPRSDSNNVEFLELYNSASYFLDISHYQVTCADMNYTFPANTLMPAGAYFVLAASPQSMANVYGLTSNVFGPYTGSLKHAETLQLLDERSNVLLTIPYSATYPWPVAADGTGHSLVLAYASYGEGDPRAWDISDVTGGSPGQMDGFRPSPLRNVVINEVLAHSENQSVPQFIELYNHSTNAVDVSGCILTDDTTVNKFVIPTGTVIAPAGFVAFAQSEFNFTLNGAGENLYFIEPDGSHIIDAVQWEAQANGVSWGRWPDGANDFYALATNTPGTNNSSILIGDVVINELMYDPISGNDDDQYIELYNKGSNTINLAGWQFTSGVKFTIPPNVTLAPGGYLVVSRNETNLFAKYPNLSAANTVGNYSGKLSHKGERVALAMPQTLFGTNILVVQDEVTYGTGGRWGEWSSGGGSSLELIDPRSNHRLAANWADSDETQKSQWVDIENTGVLDNGANYESGILHAQIGLLDTGECLVDNIEIDHNGSNYISNGTFEGGLGNWTFQGCMVRSSLESSGYQSSYSLHIRCSDRLWTGVNSCEVTLANTNLGAGQLVTLRFKARWLRGWPEPNLRLNGNWLEATGAMPVPTNLGSPGGPNSQFSSNVGPAIYSVTHSPALPAANQPVVVTARVHDPDGVLSLALHYRLDPAISYTVIPMNDSGTGGDAVRGDGIYSATIPGQVANQMVAFYITAADLAGAGTRFPTIRTNDNEPNRECLVMFGDGNPGGTFGVYHLWITQNNVTRWGNLADLSNEFSDCTFVNANRVIYNIGGRFAGSPYHQEFNTPNGNLCHYKWEFNDDEKFLGATDFNKIHQPGNGPGDDPSIQREQLANTFLRAVGVPWLYKRYVVVFVNGNRRGTLMEDTQTPGTDVIKENFPNDPDGFVYKMQPWFEMAPTASGPTIGFNNESWCNLMPYTTTGGVKKVPRYRYMFEIRRTPDSDNDFTNVFSLVDAANSYGTANYVANMENIADMENWMRVFAANHAAGNWDSFGSQNAQNLYGYIGTLGTKYSLLMWDYNIVIGNPGTPSWGPGQNLFTINSEDPNTQNILNNPTFLRMYWRALQELVNGPLALTNSGPLVDAKFNAFAQNGVSVENPNTLIKPWLSQAQSSIASQLAAVNATGFSVNARVTLSNNLAIVTGGAPVNIASILINGSAYPVTWTSLTNWTVAMPLTNGVNSLAVVGVNRAGVALAGASNQLNVTYSQPIAPAAGQIAINEIMWNPTVPGGEYVELFNNSTSNAYDLSGWQLTGVGYTFPAGSFLGARGYLVLAASRPAFAGAYGATIPVFDTFSGALTPGETISLLQPNGTSNLVVTAVRFESGLPWPTNANTQGVSLQLIDPRQDNWRAGNWSAGHTNAPKAAIATPGAANSIAASLTPFPSLWVNEVEPNNLTGITNSAGQHAPWVEIYNPGTNTLPLSGLYLTADFSNLTNWAFPTYAAINPGQFLTVFADGQTNLSTSNELHTSFALSGGTGGVALSRVYNGQAQALDYVNYTNLPPDWSYGSMPDGQSFVRMAFYSPTPGGSNHLSGAPPASFIAYNSAGSVYTQNFDSLPNPGAASVNTANPVTINGITYKLGNPFDFAAPASATGTGGLGLAGTMPGWFGLSDPTASVGTRFGATDGDQTTGGQISFGLPNGSNRALGLLATSTTGYTAIGARFINNTGSALNTISAQITGEVWRQSNVPKTLLCYYFIDPTATAAMSTQATGTLPGLNVSFPTVASDSGGAAVDGTAAANQVTLSVNNQAITNWPAGAALWLVWEMTDPTGKAQGLAIDNLSFSATGAGSSTNLPAINIQGAAGGQLVISWPVSAAGFQLYSATSLSAPIVWTPVTTQAVASNGSYVVTLPVSGGTAQFYRLAAP